MCVYLQCLLKAITKIAQRKQLNNNTISLKTNNYEYSEIQQKQCNEDGLVNVP